MYSQNVDHREEKIFSETTAIVIANDTLTSNFKDEFHEYTDGLYNVSLPLFLFNQIVELNESVSKIMLTVLYHQEIPGINMQNILITHGYQLSLANQYTSFDYSTQRATFYSEGGISSSMTASDTYTFDTEATGLFNYSEIAIDCEFIVGASSMEDSTHVSEVQNCTALFALGLEMRLEYEKLPSSTLVVLYIVPSVSVSIVGIVAILLLGKTLLKKGELS